MVLDNIASRIKGLKQAFLDIQKPSDLFLSLKRRGLLDSFGNFIRPNSQQIRKLQMAEWQKAIMAAQDPDNPNRQLLMRLYERAMYDDTVTATTEQRIMRVQQSSFAWKNKAGKVNEELTKQFKKQWFEDWMKFMLERKFFGFSLVEIDQVEATGGIKTIKLIDRRHVKQFKKIVVKRESDTTGISYIDNGMDNWVFEVGEERELGRLSKVVPLIILKSIAQGGWGRYTEVFGIPLRWVKTQSQDKKRLDALATMLQDMSLDPWAVLQGDEEFHVAENKLGAEGFKNFDEFWKRVDNAIARILLGNDGTVSNKDSSGTYGSIKTMAELQQYMHNADKTYIANLVNEFSAKWMMHGYRVDGHTFEWDEMEELGQKDLVDAVSKLAPNFELDVEYLQKRGLPIKGYRTGNSDPLGKH